MKPQTAIGMKVFAAATSIALFAALYFVVLSAVEITPSRVCGVLTGLVFAVIFVVLGNRKYFTLGIVGAAVLYTVLCVAIDFSAFVGGCAEFWNGVVAAVNANTHAGWRYLAVQAPAVEFLVLSVASVWLALGVCAIMKKNRFFELLIVAVTLVSMFCMGLYPKAPASVAIVVTLVAALLAGNGFPVKAAWCYMACAVTAVAIALSCFAYAGSVGVRNFRDAIADSFDNIVYGSDSLPEGELEKSVGMKASDAERLRVGLAAQTTTLYLKGFVGGEFDGREWKPTDKNKYVENGNQGLMEYAAQSGIPLLQYAKYASLGGNTARYNVYVKNVGANKKYVYSPYSASSYSVGEFYYDLNIRGGASDVEYSFAVCDSEENRESVTQAGWLTDDGVHTADMEEYLARERQYRAFAYDTYARLDTHTADVVRAAVGDVDAGSINTVTTLLRAHFLKWYRYDEKADKFGKNFVEDFFGGKIERANSAYFATAAAHIYRLYGFPARYAEGYLVRSGGGEEVQSVSVRGNSAHAWTEVYFDGIGWLPIEVTPSFFSEEEPGVTVDPDSDNTPDPPENDDPTTPPDDPEEPDTPDPPPHEDNGGGKTPSERGLEIALKILLPMASVMLAALLAVLAVAVRKTAVLRCKRRRMNSNGEEYGRVAYSVVERDCKRIGGFSADNLEKHGVSRERTARFISLIEKSVYGGYDLAANEKNIVEHYIDDVADAVLLSGGRLKYLYLRYIVCVGLRF